MLEGLLPIGSVVLLKNSTKRVMIIGFCQKNANKSEVQLWDYAGIVFPEGYLAADKVFLFNHEQVEKIYALGYQDEEQFVFKEKIDNIAQQFRKEQN
ncbi:MAG: DUF4176 domain-containing protein [Oscillospiraceae bacterium]|jgi:hypothetical protein|nr:DUF4176 domain-containing protein [Oscillospiraceae bacterium]